MLAGYDVGSRVAQSVARMYPELATGAGARHRHCPAPPFGGSDKHKVSVRHFYSATAQASSVVGLIKELGLSNVVIAGYDVGSRVAQSVARMHPDLVHALVLSPPLPGAGERVLTAQAQGEFWYQAFHQLPLAAQLIDGKPRRRPRILAALLESLVRSEFHPLRR